MGRRNQEAEAETEVGGVRFYKTQEERDAALEARYTYDKELFDMPPWASTCAVVSAYQDQFCDEFLLWWGVNKGPLEERLQTWEATRFGAMLDKAAHGLLLFKIKRGSHSKRIGG